MPQRSEKRLEPRNFSEIVDLIVDELGNPDVRAQVFRAIEDSFTFFRRWDRWFARHGKVDLFDKAKEIGNLIAALESKLEALPPPLYNFLFTPPWARGSVMPSGLLAVRTTFRAEALGPLRRMRLDCERFLADEKKEMQHPTHGPEVDRAQRHCAILAYNLMAALSERRITSYAEGHYVRVASLLFEALKGRAEVDLKRHCQSVIKTRRKWIVAAE
jgi:hypothetical protein